MNITITINAKNTIDMNNILKLPNEIIKLIKDFLPIRIIVFTNKQNYNLHHKCLKKYINNYENYIRNTLRSDNSFVFEKIMRENYKKWFEIKNYIYKNMIFKNYIYFIINYCIDNESTKCNCLIKEFLKELGFSKNLHKKNIIKHIRWKN